VRGIKRIHLLFTNDVHSRFERMARIYTLAVEWRRRLAAAGEEGLVLDIGDHMDRAFPETEGTDGEANRLVLEKTGYDAVTLGNNELLTFTRSQLAQTYEGASFVVVSNNVVKRETGEPPSWIRPGLIVERAGVRIGLLAVTIPYPIVYELMGWQVSDPFDVLRREVKRMRGKADLVVVLSHFGLSNDRRLAEEVDGIDLILGGHTHHLLEEPVRQGNTWIAAAGKFGEHVGFVTVEWDATTRRVWNITGRSVPTDGVEAAPELLDLIRHCRRRAEKRLGRPVAWLKRDLPLDWQGESPFGNLLADSLREWTEAELGLANSGLLLSALCAGPVTRGELHRICPHPINPVRIALKGEHIRRALEESLLPEFFSAPVRGYGFRGKVLGSLCVSGLTVEVDPYAEPYRKIRSIRVGERELRDGEEYTVGTVDMFTFGTGYLSLKEGKLLRYYMPEFLRDLLVWQLKREDAVEAGFVKRWKSTHG
jgi:2',3'-cyclic-nucleotide 2'-phosphodiesterase (5'-nucleotidase family)